MDAINTRQSAYFNESHMNGPQDLFLLSDVTYIFPIASLSNIY